ncbi:MAG: hypothetical protein R3Y43_08535 [Alphaproteobacteria bacterium]
MNKTKLILITSLLLITIGCSTKERPILKSPDGSEIPPYYTLFPDIPFPEPATIDLEETKALGSGKNWIGSLVYTTPYNASAVYDFHMTEMPKMQWTEVATVRTKISQMTYIKSGRAVQILIERDGSSKAKVSITAIPNETN